MNKLNFSPDASEIWVEIYHYLCFSLLVFSSSLAVRWAQLVHLCLT